MPLRRELAQAYLHSLLEASCCLALKCQNQPGCTWCITRLLQRTDDLLPQALPQSQKLVAPSLAWDG